jgi:aminoglycoside 6-adenylyltransferase
MYFMRSEQEMMDLILGVANEDERVRAVLLSGSRANPNAKRDFFQDFDIVYIVNEIETFTSNDNWVDIFGERIMMQMPEDKVLPPALNNGTFVYLMWFKDGNRIDLTLIPQVKMKELFQPDSLSTLLLDKDGILPSLQKANDKDYLIQQPTEKEFQDTCNEFWWICMNISKGLWRKELSYTMFMYEQINRNMLMRMMRWSIGVQTDFSTNVGAFGKYFKHFLKEEEWKDFVLTYTDAKEEHIWDALFIMCDLFRNNAMKVAAHFEFMYPIQDDQNVTAHLKHVRNLPEDAISY